MGTLSNRGKATSGHLITMTAYHGAPYPGPIYPLSPTGVDIGIKAGSARELKGTT